MAQLKPAHSPLDTPLPSEQNSPASQRLSRPQKSATTQVKYWSHKETGIKSRPIKPIKHPIENINRKIILTYLLGFTFKLIAILTGPLIVLLIYLISVPFVLARRLVWSLLNLPCLCDARIRTLSASTSSILSDEHLPSTEPLNKNDAEDKQTNWRYCPLDYIESYWFKERLVNLVILVIEGDDRFSLDELRLLVRNSILSRPAFRKFLSRVESRGLPLYKGLYWRHLGLADENLESLQENNSCGCDRRAGSSDRDSASLGRFSLTEPSVCASLDPAGTHSVILARPSQEIQGDVDGPVQISQHVYLDQTLLAGKRAVRQYARDLLDEPLDLRRPLWDLRVLPDKDGRMYLMFRCHQSLADGRSLAGILMDHLVVPQSAKVEETDEQTIMSSQTKPAIISQTEAEAEATNEELKDNELQPIKSGASFVSRISRSEGFRSAIFVGPLTVLLWIIWTFSRRKNNHLNKCAPTGPRSCYLASQNSQTLTGADNDRRLYMAHYDLTKFYQIKQITRSTASDVILCALSGALRDYLRRFNGVTNPPNLNVSLMVDMRQRHSTKVGRGANHHHEESSSASTMSVSTTMAKTSAAIGQAATERPHQLGSSDGKGAVWPQVNCTLVNVPLPTSVEGVVPRLWELRGTMDELRTSADPWVMLGLQRFLFDCLPTDCYRWLINYITLRNSSTFMSNIRGPQNLVEAWCVDLSKRAVYEALQPPRALQPQLISSTETQKCYSGNNEHDITAAKLLQLKRQREHNCRLKLAANLGSLAAIYYCMQPPTSNIPISFNCITYNNKLFVTSLSRSLLVEDSKLLLKLFFRQLDQLAETIAKRKSLFTLIRTPVPIEISCEPASPGVASVHSSFGQEEQLDQQVISIGQELDLDEQASSEHWQPRRSSVSYPRDDLEANIPRVDRCATCRQTVCCCSRRKSLFSVDYSKQHGINLLSLLRPFMGKSRSRESNQEMTEQQQPQTSRSNNECHYCGCQLIEENDDVLDDIECDENGQLESSEPPSRASPAPSNVAHLGLRSGRLPGSQTSVSCPRCRMTSMRSTLSLNECAGRQYWSRQESQADLGRMGDSAHSKSGHSSSQQLPLPSIHSAPGKTLSKSETNLVPPADERQPKQKGFSASKVSWLAIGRHNYRKLSLFSANRSLSPGPSRSDNKHADQQSAMKPSRSQNLFNSARRADKRAGGDTNAVKRRQSVATTTGASHIHRSVIVKDETNADIQLRFHLDGSRARRPIGNVVGIQARRASLIPFGLMHSTTTSFPKLFLNDNETHL